MKVKKWLLRVHRYVGLLAGLLLVMSGLTGSLLVFSDEIDEALNPGLLHVTPRESRASLQSVVDGVRTAYPHDKLLRIRMPRAPEGVYEFWINSNEGLRVYVDPYSGVILGSRFPHGTLKGFLFALHTQLFIGETGKTVVGIGALSLLALGMTGVLLWWPGRRKLSRGFTIKWRANWKRVSYDTHNVVGIFAVAFLSVSAITGVHLVFNAPFERAVNWLTFTPPRPAPPASTVQADARPPSLDVITGNADAVWPEAETTWIYPPAKSTAAFMVRKKLPGEVHPNGKSFIYLDQYSGGVLLAENALEAPLATRVVNNLYPLHMGRLGGTWTRMLQMVVGLVPAVMFITGLLVWRNRTRAARRSSHLMPLSRT